MLASDHRQLTLPSTPFISVHGADFGNKLSLRTFSTLSNKIRQQDFAVPQTTHHVEIAIGITNSSIKGGTVVQPR